MSAIPSRALTEAELEACRALEIASVAPGVEVLEGVVPSHRARKLLHSQIAEERNTKLVNGLRVRAKREPLPRSIIGSLKRDRFLAGVPISLGEPNYKSLHYVATAFDPDGGVTVAGSVPDGTYRSYLETKLWTAPGVQRVINLTSVLHNPVEEPDVECVLKQVLITDEAVPLKTATGVGAHSNGEELAIVGIRITANDANIG